MATRPGYIWSGTEWVSIGQEATVNPFAYQASAPSTPATGDIWVDSDDTVPSIDSAQFLRWRKTVAGGETSLSGNDDTSLPLQYTAGYEQLYINGVLQVRTLDYVATTGTTITGLTALALNDVVEIFSVVARLVGDVYTQAQADAKYATQATVNALPSGALVYITTAAMTTATTNIDGCFTSAYDNYKIIITGTSPNTSALDPTFGWRTAGVTDNTSIYYSNIIYSLNSSGPLWYYSGGITYALVGSTADIQFTNSIEVYSPKLAKITSIAGQGNSFGNSLAQVGIWYNNFNAATQFDGVSIRNTAGQVLTGTATIYGYRKA